jgi:hypothetical protein
MKRPAATIGALPTAPKLEPTAAAYAREVKLTARTVLRDRREKKADRAFALDRAADLVNRHKYAASYHRALAVLLWTGNRAAGWPSPHVDFEIAIQQLAEAAMLADVWAVVQAKLPAKLREAPPAPRASRLRDGTSTRPVLRDGYANVSEAGRYRSPVAVPPEGWEEEMLTRDDVLDAVPCGTISLYGDRLQAFEMADGRFAAVTLASSRS